MGIQKIIRRRIRKRLEGVDVVGDVNAVVSANVGEKGTTTSQSSRQRVAQKSRSSAVSGDPGGDEGSA